MANNAATVTSPTIDVSKATDYMLDAAGNRRQTTVDATTSVYQLSSDSQTRDAAMNQYTRIGNTYLTHDAAGNTLSSSELGLQRFFDGENQLVQWAQAGKDVRYRYDATGRRVLKQDANSSFATVLYFYDGWHDAEEATTGGVVTKRYVYGENVDEPIRVTLADFADSDNDSNTSETVDLYYHQNSLGSVVALTTVTGSVVESYRYSAYGTPTILNKNGIEVSTTQVQQPFMFTGRRWDFEEGSGLYYYRLRYYDPASGRFVSRDPLGLWGDPTQNGSAQSFCNQNAVNLLDPFGLNSIETGHAYPFDFIGPLREGDYRLSRGETAMFPGRYAGDSIEARGPKSTHPLTPAERAAITEIGKQTGCHTCGKKGPLTPTGNFIPDHQPADGTCAPGTRQRLFPHCAECSPTQGPTVRDIRSGARPMPTQPRVPKPVLPPPRPNPYVPRPPAPKPPVPKPGGGGLACLGWVGMLCEIFHWTVEFFGPPPPCPECPTGICEYHGRT